MEILTPNAGTIFWTTLCFLIVLFILKKYAWKPILTAIKEREQTIEKSLNAAKLAREEVEKMKTENERILKEAKEERDKIIAETQLLKESLIREAKEKAEEEAKKLIRDARAMIREEKEKAFFEMKEQIVDLSVNIAGKILQKEFEDKEKYKELIDESLHYIKLN